MEYTEREKKAIENVKIILNSNIRNPFLDDEADSIDILLNLLEKYQKEIERLQNKDKEYIKIENNNLEWQKKYNELKKATENSRQFKVYISGMRSGKELLNKYINDSIPKDNIREKIKEIDENGYWDFLEERDCEKTINILKELLGDE